MFLIHYLNQIRKKGCKTRHSRGSNLRLPALGVDSATAVSFVLIMRKHFTYFRSREQLNGPAQQRRVEASRVHALFPHARGRGIGQPFSVLPKPETGAASLNYWAAARVAIVRVRSILMHANER